MTVVSGDARNGYQSVEKLLTYNKKESEHLGITNFWLSHNNHHATFILNLGCPMMFNKIQVANTHSAQWKDRATREFK